MTGAERGHRTVPHTADVRVEAWGPTREDCLAEAAAALVAGFADISAARPERTVVADLPVDTDEDLLVAVLDEVIFTVDTQDVVPLAARIVDRPGRVRLHMPVTATRNVEIIGAIPKAVTLSGLRLSRHDGHWWATATIDV